MPCENMNLAEVRIGSEITGHLAPGVQQKEVCRAARLLRASYEWRLMSLGGPTLGSLKSCQGVSLLCPPLCTLTRFFHCLRYDQSLLFQKAET